MKARVTKGKFATIRLKDGYGPNLGAGLVNNVSGYAAAAVTMVVDGFTGAVAVGDQFTVASHNTLYTITAHTETSGHTTSITFTPGLVDAAVDDDTVNIQTHFLDIHIGEGTLTFDEKRKMEYKLDRGLLYSVREGDQEPMDVRFDFIWEFLTGVTSSGIATVEDALKKRGEASNWVTSGADPCEPYALDVQIKYDPPCTGIDHELITLEEFRWESLNHEAKQGQVACAGKCNRLQSTAARYAA